MRTPSVILRRGHPILATSSCSNFEVLGDIGREMRIEYKLQIGCVGLKATAYGIPAYRIWSWSCHLTDCHVIILAHTLFFNTMLFPSPELV